MTRFILAICCLLLPLTSIAATSVDKVAVQLSWKFQFQFAPIIAAYEKGFYREAGLDVEIIEGGPGIHAVDQVISGKADFGIYSSALVLEYAKEKPVVALATIMQHSPVSIITDKDEIGGVLDLVGKTIAVSPDTRDEIIAYLKAIGINGTHVNIVAKTKWGIANLEDHDAISAYISNEGFFTHNSDKNFKVFSPRAAGIDLFGNILFTSRALVEDKPDQVARFTQATLRGLRYALDNPTELTSIIIDKYNTQNKLREHLLFEAEKIRELTRTDIVEPGHMSPGRWRHVAEVYADLGKIPRDMDLKEFIYNPNPEADLRWLYGTLVLLIIIAIAVSAALISTRRLAKRLKEEIREHHRTSRKLKASETRFEDLFYNNPDPCWLIYDNKFIECNEEAVRILGYESKEALQSVHPCKVSPPHQPDGQPSQQKADRMMQIAMAKGIHRFEWTHQKMDGTLFPVEVTMAKVAVDDKDILYCIWRDISERKRIDKMKSEFISTVSHELRTPLTAIIGSLGLIQGGAMGEAPEQVRSLIDVCKRNSDRLLVLINDILDLSKIESGKMQYSMALIELNQLIESSMQQNEHYATQYGVKYRFIKSNRPIQMNGDDHRLSQVFGNLLSNAAKFSGESKHVEIKISSDGREAMIEVIDHGTGIPEKFHDRIFTMFTQADGSDTRRTGGTGLGLNITKSIVEAHGGSIWFESKENIGTTFFVRLPILKG